MSFLIRLLNDEERIIMVINSSFKLVFFLFLLLLCGLPFTWIVNMLISIYTTAVVTPVLIWEEMVSQFQDTTLTNRLLSYNAPSTIYSISTSSCKISLMYLFIVSTFYYKKLSYTTEMKEDDWVYIQYT